MKKSDHQWFAFVPSTQESRKATSPTHYLPNRGIVTLKPEITRHIVECARSGVSPKLFGVGWWDEDLQEFRVGLSIPTERKKSRRSEANARSPQELFE